MNSSLRRGLTLLETTTALVIVTAMLVLVVQLSAVTSLQQRAARQTYQAALQVAGIMERLQACEWERLPQTARTSSLPDDAEYRLPEAELDIDIEPAEGSASRRIEVELTWTTRSGDRQSSRLVAWRYAPAEGRP